MHHLETSPETFRVVEAKEKAEDLMEIVEGHQDTAEDPIPKVREREEMIMIEITRNGMIGNQLEQAKARDHRMNIVTTVVTVTLRKNLREENPQGTTLETLRIRKRKEQEVLVKRDTIGEIEA